jgi:hypothetical protein
VTKPTEHIANPASTPKTGLVATLRGLLHVEGTSAGGRALNPSKGSGAPTRLILSVFATTLGALAFTSVPALAAAPEKPETLGPSLVTSTTATLNGVLNPNAVGEVGGYEFLYNASTTKCAGGRSAPGGSQDAFGGKKEAESVEVTGLTPDTRYTFCLLARNGEGYFNGGEEEAAGAPVTFRTPVAEYVTNVVSSGASLNADINPEALPTTYRFEYGPSGAYGSSLPAPDGSVGAGTSAVAVNVALKNLAPASSYHYRAVVVSETSPSKFETLDGPDHTFTTPAALGSAVPAGCSNEQRRVEQPYGLGLPDCRAYEMVSPLEKGDSDAVVADSPLARSSLSGNTVAYESAGSYAEPEGKQLHNDYMARREADGWANTSLGLQFTAYKTAITSPYEALIFTPELSEGLAKTDVPLPGSGAKPGFADLYTVNFAQHSYRLVNSEPAQEPYAPNIEGFEVAGVSTDLSHVVYRENRNGGPLLESVNGTQRVASTLPNGSAVDAAPGVQYGGYAGDFWRSVSADGSRVFFTYPWEPRQTRDEQLYVREAGERTVEVSASQRTDCNVQRKEAEPGYVCSGTPEPDPAGPQQARYWGASTDGSRVFFTSCAKLTNDARAVGPGRTYYNNNFEDCVPGAREQGRDLYEYEVNPTIGEPGLLKDLTVDGGEVDGAKVMGVVDISENGSLVYLVAQGVLASGGAVAGQPNLYLYREGAAKPLKFIATLAPGNNTIPGQEDTGSGDSADWSSAPSSDNVRYTPDGTRLAFLSIRSLTGYDNTPANATVCIGNVGGLPAPCREVYIYDANTEKLACVSCNPTGARPIGRSSFSVVEGDSAAERYLSVYSPRSFSEDGGRLFFNSVDALVPQDSNGRQDVYEWEAEGEGGCKQAGGCVYPISDVAGNYASFFLDASPNGSDVFFGSEDQLVPADTDFHIDVYDARIGGGFPVSVTPPACDNGDSCKPPVSPQPGVFGAPASATFSGAGNLAPPSAAKPALKAKAKAKPKRCKKGYVKKKGRCVRAKPRGKAGKSGGHSKRGTK